MGLASQIAIAGAKKAGKASSSITDLVKAKSASKAKEVTPQDITEYIKTTLVPKKESDKNFNEKFKDTTVVDEKNKPRVMYHGRNKDFESFDTTNAKTKTQELGTHIGTAEQANEFATREGGNVVPTYLDVKNPLRLDDYGGFGPSEVLDQLRMRGDFDEDLLDEIDDIASPAKQNKAIINLLKSNGYDGIVYLNKREGLNLKGTDKEVSTKIDELQNYDDETLIKKYGAKDSYIIFDPTQAKSIFNKGSWSESDDRLNYNKGGTVNDMNKLFAEGDMNDEGGTVDPVSGNEVPPGSLQNEVRDDIDAKLSEGEFVIPADVVRYIGLERLMKLRDEAKQGLARMAEIGQMGNADKVANPEALHEGDDGFEAELDSIMEEVEGGEKEEKEYAVGGVVNVPSADKDILAKYNIQRTAITNPALDVRLLKNAAGDSLYMTYFNGKPGSAIPEGYTVVDANPASRMTGTGLTDTTKTGSTVKQNVAGAASVDAGNQSLTTTTNNTSMTDLALGNVAVTGKDGAVTKVGDGATTTDGGLGVNSYGGAITSDATGAVSTGAGGFTLNPDGSVSANTVNKGLTAAAGIVNPVLGIAARINNAVATKSAADFTRSIADTMGTNTDTSTAAATAGPTGTGGSAASAASDAAAAASSMGLSGAAAGAASQAAANVIARGGNAADAAEAGRVAAADVASSEQSSTEILGTEEREAAYRESLGGFDVAGPMDFGGGTGGGGKYFDDQGMATMAMAKGGLVAKRMKKPTPARKTGIASKR